MKECGPFVRGGDKLNYFKYNCSNTECPVRGRSANSLGRNDATSGIIRVNRAVSENDAREIMESVIEKAQMQCEFNFIK